MSMPVNKKAVDRLQEAYDKNMEAGDWVVGTGPLSQVPIPEEGDIPQEVAIDQVIRRAGKAKFPRKQ